MVQLTPSLNLLAISSVLGHRTLQLCEQEAINEFISLDTKKPYTPQLAASNAASYRTFSREDVVLFPDAQYLCPLTLTAHLIYSSIVKMLGVDALTEEQTRDLLEGARTWPERPEKFSDDHFSVITVLEALGLGYTFSDPAHCRPGDICQLWHVSEDGDYVDGYAGIVANPHQAVACGAEFARHRDCLWLFGAVWNGKGVGFDYWRKDKTRDVDGVLYERRLKFIRLFSPA